jgi:hypothetical protein
MATSDCVTGNVCGRFDFRAIDPDSGMLSGPPTDVLNVCRPRLNAVCATNGDCASPGAVCLAPSMGVCSRPCSLDQDCASALCLPAASPAVCGTASVCAPLCDDLTECPQPGWYCNMANVNSVGHGRCEPISGTMASDAACFDATG